MALIPSCPANCYPDLPVFSFPDCPKDVATRTGQIEYIYLASEGFPLTAVTDLGGARVSNTSTNNDAIRKLTVIGSKPAPTDTFSDLPLGQRKLLRRVHTLPFRIYDMSDANNESVRLLQCNADDLYIGWYQDSAGNQWGGLAGLAMKSFEIHEIIPESRDEFSYYEGVLTWETPYTPERYNLTTLS
jgi:hypothetical protein